ncbi:MAG TPA: hypothetical protein PKE30_07160 [Niabella sp.]|nr:hypothetical protein [Niabella sp.]
MHSAQRRWLLQKAKSRRPKAFNVRGMITGSTTYSLSLLPTCLHACVTSFLGLVHINNKNGLK